MTNDFRIESLAAGSPKIVSNSKGSYCQKLWMEHQAAISSSRTPLMNFTFSMTSPRRR